MNSIPPDFRPPSPPPPSNVVMNRLLRESLRQLRAERAAEEAARTPKKPGPKPGADPRRWSISLEQWEAALAPIRENYPTRYGRIKAMAIALSTTERTIRRYINRAYPID